jgi:beta-lactamase regulating signal transducer with metallopeptidase domain
MLPISDSIQMRLVLVLAHFLWQGALIAALLAGIVAIARVRLTRVRYAASLLSLVLMAACPVITWCWLPEIVEQPNAASNAPVSNVPVLSPAGDGDAPTVVPSLRRRDAASDNAILPTLELAEGESGLPTPAVSSNELALNPVLPPAPPAWWQPAVPWIVAAWLIGVAVFSLRLLIGTVGTWRWRRQLEPLPQSLALVVEQLCGLLGMRVPRVSLSSRVTEAVAIGLFRPLVLLPASWATSIPPDMLEGILAHELAHIRRYDLWVNLFQRVVEALFFYHPAVWWLSKRLRTERELCCDDLAVSVTRDRVRYAEMLEHVGRMRLSQRLSPVAVSIANPKRALLERVRHVLRPGATDDVRGSSVIVAMLLALLVVCGALITSSAGTNLPESIVDAAPPMPVLLTVPEARPIMVGEPSWIAIKFQNVSDKNVVLRLNGDYRNRLTHPIDEPAESLIVDVVDERGQKVAQPVAEAARSGVITSDHPIRARGDASIELFVPHWVMITKPGRYRVTVRCRGKLFPDTGRQYFMETPDTRELTAETTLAVVPANAGKFGELIEEWGRKLVGGKTQETHAEAERAHRMLKVLHDERVVPWYVKLLNQPRYDSKFSACDGLAPYGSEAAFAALKRAMATKGADVHETATGKLAEGSADGIRHTAAVALSKNPHPEAATFLLEQAKDRYSAVRITVLHFAAENKSPQARRVIDTMTRDKDERVATEAKRYQKLLADEDAKVVSKQPLKDADGGLTPLAQLKPADDGAVGSRVPAAVSAPERIAIDRAIAFLQSRQRDDGTWFEEGAPADGQLVLPTVALLQAGVKAEDAVVQKALPRLRKIEPKMIYIVALQTMALCAASPKEDAELIRRNVAWIENAQVKEGDATGGWSYAATPAGRADGSCSRFAILGLDAAKRANFEVNTETWQRAATYWMKGQRNEGGWGYTPGAPQTLSMTLAGVAGLATAHRYLPKDDQAAAREAALFKPRVYIDKMISAPPRSFPFYSYHALERAGHLTKTEKFGDVDWKSVVTKQLLDQQRQDGAWGQANTTENHFIATSFALMFLSGRPDAPADGKPDEPAMPDNEKQKPKGGDLQSGVPPGRKPRAEQMLRANRKDMWGEVPAVRGRLMIDGPIPVVPMRTVSTSRGLMPRKNEVQSRFSSGPDLKLPDDSLVISKEGGIANGVIYLKKAPKDWKPSAPPTEPVVIEAIDNRFVPHMSFIRTGQPLTLLNSMAEAANFHSQPVRGSPHNMVLPARGEMLVRSPYSQSESLPNTFGSDIQPWMKGCLLALDHPFAAITDDDGRFEIRDLPAGEHHFTVWHERCGYLNKDLVVRVEDEKVTEVDLKYTAAQFELRSANEPTPRGTPAAASPAIPKSMKSKLAKLVEEVNGLFRDQRFADAELLIKKAVERDPDNVELRLLALVTITASRMVVSNDESNDGAPLTVQLVRRYLRRKSNDRGEAAKLVGRWLMTLPRGFVYEAEIKSADDGCLTLSGPKSIVLFGTFARHGDRLALVETNDEQIGDYVWQVQSQNRLTLVTSETNNGADYTGAKLERQAEAPRKDGEKKEGDEE